MLFHLVRGLVLGFSIAAPVGPIGVLCIRRTLNDGRRAGLLTGLGAATADALYGCVAAFGLTLVSSFLLDKQAWLRLIGGAFLCYLGVRTWLARPAERSVGASARGLAGSYLSALALTITNPMTILSFAAVFAGLGLAGTGGSYGQAVVMVLGVFLGSAAWWLLLSSAVSILRARFTPRWMLWVNRLSGLVVLAFGISALLRSAT